MVIAEPDIALGDCRIEWADGGVTRDSAKTEAAIAEMVRRYVTARAPEAPMCARSVLPELGEIQHE